jgi:hypothetical protein
MLVEMWKYHTTLLRFPRTSINDNAQQCPKIWKEGLQLQNPIQVPWDILGLIDAKNDMQTGDATNARMAGCDMMSAWPSEQMHDGCNKCKCDNKCQGVTWVWWMLYGCNYHMAVQQIFLAPNRDHISISIILCWQIWYWPGGCPNWFFCLQYTSTFSSGSLRFFDFHQHSILYYLYVHFHHVLLSI